MSKRNFIWKIDNRQYWKKKQLQQFVNKHLYMGIWGKEFIYTSFEGIYGVAFNSVKNKSVTYLNDSIVNEILRFVRIKAFTQNFATFASCVIWLIDSEILVRVHFVSVLIILNNEITKKSISKSALC